MVCTTKKDGQIRIVNYCYFLSLDVDFFGPIQEQKNVTDRKKKEVEPIWTPPQASKSTTFKGWEHRRVRIAHPFKGAPF